MTHQGKILFGRFHKIILASYGALILISVYLFWIEYTGVYKNALSQLDLYARMEEKVFDNLEATSSQSTPILKKDLCTFGIIDEAGKIIKHSHVSQSKPMDMASFFPHELKGEGRKILEKIHPRVRTEVGDFWIYKAPLKGTPLIFVAFTKREEIQKRAFYEAIDTLLSIIGALTILLVVVYALIKREFIKPAKELIHHLEQESKGLSTAPHIHKGWQPWVDTITTVFGENRRLMGDLEDHIKNLDQKVLERTQEIQRKNQQLEEALKDLRKAQDQIILQEKMASLGALTAGIAHEMKNPLNFVLNFSEVSQELIQDLLDSLKGLTEIVPEKLQQDIQELAHDLTQNMSLIQEHGQRADHIVRSMLLHAHGGEAEKQKININQLFVENVDLAVSGFKSRYGGFSIGLETHLDPRNPVVFGVLSDIGRIFLNIINNGCHALWERSQKEKETFKPVLTLSTEDLADTDKVKICIKDNGTGIPKEIHHKIFDPFFSTKPPGQGTGLGLSMCYKMILNNGGTIDIDTEPGQYTEFIIHLPKA